MASVGVLNSSLTMTDNGFSATLNTGAAKAQQFGKTINTGSQSFIGFNAKTLESRKALGTMAMAAQTSAGSILHIVYAFQIFGPEVGAAIATIMVLNEVFSAEAAAAEKAAQSTAKFHQVMKDLKEFRAGTKETEGQKKMHEIGEEFSRLRDERLELQKTIRPFGLDTGIRWQWGTKERLVENAAEVKRLTANYNDLKSSMGGFVERHLSHAVSGRELGVLRLEHTMQARSGDPMLTEAQKQTALLEQIAGKREMRVDILQSGRRQMWGSFSQQAGL